MALKISESAAVQMPMKTVASLITMVAIGTWAYFGLHETLNQHSTKIELMQKDLDQNNLSDCLKSKRIAQNEVNPERVVFSCQKVKAQTEIYMDRKKIVKILP